MRVGTKVSWHWGTGTAHGKVVEVITKTIEKTIKGSHITRHGSADDPALLIETEDGDEVLKLTSEVEKA